MIGARCSSCHKEIGEPFEVLFNGEFYGPVIGICEYCPHCGNEDYTNIYYKKISEKPRFRINRTKAFMALLTALIILLGITHLLGWWNVYDVFGWPTPYN